jgi:hypothetical protein
MYKFKKEEKLMNFFKNLKNKIVKNRVGALAGATGITAFSSSAFCIDAFTGKLDTVVNFVYTIAKYAGFVLIAVGVVQLIRCVIALTGGDQLQPGQLGKAIGMIAAGIAATLLKSLVGALS